MKKKLNFTTEALAEWLRAQPPKTTYDFYSISGCLLAKFGQAQGFPRGHSGSYSFCPEHGNMERVYLEEDASRVARDEPHTYGAALARCEKIIAARSALTGTSGNQ